MSNPIIALTDLVPLAVGADGDLPRMPALERLLARADRVAQDVSSWRHWVHEATGWPLPGPELPAGALLAAAGPDEQGTRSSLAAGTMLLASPVHLVAALDHVQLGGAGILPLTAAAGRQLAGEFNAEFAAAGVTLLPVAEVLLLCLDASRELLTSDPALLAGRDIGSALPRGADGADLRRLMTEIQMWLHRRVALLAAAPTLVDCNCLWPWGAAALPPQPAGVRMLRTSSQDAYLQALAALIERSPARDTRAAPVVVTTHSLVTLGREGATDVFASADRDWFGSLPTRQFTPGVAAVEVYVAGSIFRLARGQSWRVWRSVRPWWEQLQ